MNILSVFPLPGISYTHDASACIVAGGEIVVACEEERFTRGQHAIGCFPERAAVSALKVATMPPTEVDQLVVTSMDRCQEQVDYSRRLQYVKEQLNLSASVPVQVVPVQVVPHHLAHSALARSGEGL